jgi:hypothetical protein
MSREMIAAHLISMSSKGDDDGRDSEEASDTRIICTRSRGGALHPSSKWILGSQLKTADSQLKMEFGPLTNMFFFHENRF